MAGRVLITGHGGYIGSVLTSFFLQSGYDVVGVDTGYFQECTLVADAAHVPAACKDIRDLEPDDLRGFHAVVHLAALSNDPVGSLAPRWTEEINFEASVRLAALAKAAGVRRFLFSSSCIMYGMAEERVATETSRLDPRTDYARSKAKSEEAIRELADDAFSPTFLRNGTVYGLSPRMRFDTVLNNLMGSALTTGKVVVHGDGTPWRPVVHIEDLARSFLAVLGAPLALVHNQTFNNGADHLNYRIIELAEIVAGLVPACTVEVLSSPSADSRTYRADFGKFAAAFPGFEFKWTAKTGGAQLYQALKAIGLSAAQFNSPHFTRLSWMRHLLGTGRLDGSLRWRAEEESR